MGGTFIYKRILCIQATFVYPSNKHSSVFVRFSWLAEPLLLEIVIRPKKIISVFRVMGRKILGRVGAHIFFNFFSEYNISLCILKGISPFKMHKIIFFSENLKIILGFTRKFRKGQVTLNTSIFLFGLGTKISFASLNVLVGKRRKTVVAVSWV